MILLIGWNYQNCRRRKMDKTLIALRRMFKSCRKIKACKECKKYKQLCSLLMSVKDRKNGISAIQKEVERLVK